MDRPGIHEGCGGKIEGIYIRVGKPPKWVSLGRLCLTCRWWQVWNLTPDTAGGVVSGAKVTVVSLNEVSTVTPPDSAAAPPFLLAVGAGGLASDSKLLAAHRAAGKLPCTCGSGERAKGKHNKKCPARGGAQ